MRRGVRQEPPAPIHGLVTTRTLLNGHLVSLEGIVTQKMTKQEQDQEVKRICEGDQWMQDPSPPSPIIFCSR